MNPEKANFLMWKSYNPSIIENQGHCVLSHADQIRSWDEDPEMDKQMSKDIKKSNHNENNQHLPIQMETDEN